MYTSGQADADASTSADGEAGGACSRALQGRQTWVAPSKTASVQLAAPAQPQTPA